MRMAEWSGEATLYDIIKEKNCGTELRQGPSKRKSSSVPNRNDKKALLKELYTKISKTRILEKILKLSINSKYLYRKKILAPDISVVQDAGR